MSNERDVQAEPVQDTPAQDERVLGPGAAGDVEHPAVAPAGTMPLEPLGEVGATDTLAETPDQVEPVADTINAPATEATHEGTES